MEKIMGKKQCKCNSNKYKWICVEHFLEIKINIYLIRKDVENNSTNTKQRHMRRGPQTEEKLNWNLALLWLLGCLGESHIQKFCKLFSLGPNDIFY